MSYIQPDNVNFTDDLLIRKEFYWNKIWKNKKEVNLFASIIPRFLLEDSIRKSNNLRLSSYQMFVSNFVNPNTPYKRLLLQWETGTGKTIGTLSIAMNFIKNFKLEKEIGHVEIGSVFIIGFSERVFKNELLRFPEFGFLSKEERFRLDKLKKIAAQGNQTDINKYQEMIIRIKKRFSNRKDNGYFKFIGYKAFVNKILITDINTDLNSLSEEQIREFLNEGKIKYNEELLLQFKNSLMICDEIHNVYNSVEKNNWGIAIQAVLDKEPTCRVIFASATPLNNSPTEIVDLLNLLLPKEERIAKSDFFTSEKELKPGALDKIAKLSIGRISYVRDVNPKYYPSVSIIGETIPSIPYLKFIRCPMSDFQYNTYKTIYTGVLSQDCQYISDFVIENPDKKSNVGLFQTNQIKTSLINASQEWKDKHGFNFKNNKIVGNALSYDKLKKYSNKYFCMLEKIHEVIANRKGKIFIYHNIVHMSGVLFIEQILLRNGFLDEFGGASNNTICMICGKTRAEHSKDELQIIVGGEDNDKYNPLLLLEKKRKIRWFRNGIEIMTIHKRKNNKGELCYYIPHNTMDDSLIQAKSYVLKDLIVLFNKFIENNVDCLEFQVPAYAPKLGEWLLHMSFKLKSHNNKFSILKWNLYDKLKENEGGSIIKKKKEKFKNKLHRQSVVTKKISKDKDNIGKHIFTPVRFIMANSEIDKSHMDHSIEKFNNPENANGSRIMILVGSKIIKESYDIKAIQNIFIMGKPDNIPTLLQIRGRAVRKNSHIDLPLDKRHVDIYIFTSCLPNKITSGVDKGHYELSYEEKKYREKILSFQIMQKIEKVMHENSIDSFINYDMISQVSQKFDPLSTLTFDPNISKKFTKELSLDQLNLSTFNIHYIEKEINFIKIIIKRLFIEISGVWKYQDLFEAVKNSKDYEIEVNTALFSEDNFVIAISQLIWFKSQKYVEPFITKKEELHLHHNHPDFIVDRLYNDTEKIILLPSGQESIIVELYNNGTQYYLLFPINKDTNEPDIDMELIYRVSKQDFVKTINMNSFIQNKRVDFDYDDKKNIFYRRYLDTSIENMENVICEYGASFHVKFLEECIEYVFNVWTSPKIEKSPYHDFYFKMLYYYDLLSLVMWVYTSKQRVAKDYSKYAIPVHSNDIKLKVLSRYEKKKENMEDISVDDTSDLATSGVINLLKSSINRSSNVWIPSEFREQFNKTVSESLNLFVGKKKKKREINKVSAMLLPIGHYISKFPHIYHPEKGWTEDPIYVQKDQNFVENDIIIGYDDKSATGVHIRFKLRNPIHNIKKYTDTRLVEKGSVCKSKSKSYLKKVAHKLNITVPDKINIEELCSMIRSKLIRLELKERIKKSNIKYFYFIYEESISI